jgi:hypothetical protein
MALSRIANSFRRWLTLSAASAVLIAGMAPRTAVASPAQEAGSGAAAAAAHPQLRLGSQQRSSKDVIAVPLELVLPDGAKVHWVRTEIELGSGPWKFRKADKPQGSDLKVSVRQRTQQRPTVGRGREKVTAISISVSSGEQGLPAGAVAVLNFSLENRESGPLPLTIRESEFVQNASAHTPMLEPPSKDTPVNPTAGCFFFTH